MQLEDWKYFSYNLHGGITIPKNRPLNRRRKWRRKNSREGEMSPSRKYLLEWCILKFCSFSPQYKCALWNFFPLRTSIALGTIPKVLSVISATISSQNSIPSNTKNPFVFQNFQNHKHKKWKINERWPTTAQLSHIQRCSISTVLFKCWFYVFS